MEYDFGSGFPGSGQMQGQSEEEEREIQQLQAAIDELEEELSGVYAELGRMYYEKNKSEPADEELAPLVEEASGYLGTMEEKRGEIRKIKGLVLCDSCGEEVSKLSAYCSCCGARLIPEAPAGACVCPKCGTVTEPGQKFCIVCGQRLGQKAEPEKKACLHCGALIEVDSLFCNKCGRSQAFERVTEETGEGPVFENVAEEGEESQVFETAAEEIRENRTFEYVTKEAGESQAFEHVAVEVSAEKQPKEKELREESEGIPEPVPVESLFTDGAENISFSQENSFPESELQYCTECGAKLAKNARFCIVCGFRVR